MSDLDSTKTVKVLNVMSPSCTQMIAHKESVSR